jgi:DDE family transposase
VVVGVVPSTFPIVARVAVVEVPPGLHIYLGRLDGLSLAGRTNGAVSTAAAANTASAIFIMLEALLGLDLGGYEGIFHSDLEQRRPQLFCRHRARSRATFHEHARDVARSFADTEDFEKSRRERKKIEMRFAHLKRILKLGRLRLRGPRGAQDEFVLAAIAQNLRQLASLVARPPPTQALCIA